MNGIINVYKEKGYTSHDVVAKLRGILKQKKIGHTGTLDPEAEGVLPVCLGKATKVCGLLTDKDKEYETVLLLGRVTDTQDTTGTLLEERAVDSAEEQIRAAIHSFEGNYAQIPPMYSALKVNGKKLCDLARAGVEVERKPRPVTIYRITILSVSLPRVRMRVQCSKGTYIRTLCHDIGRKLGCGGCMESLVRTRAAGFCLEEAYRLSEIERQVKQSSGLEQEKGGDKIGSAEAYPFLKPTDVVFREYPCVSVKPWHEKLLRNGNPLDPEGLEGWNSSLESGEFRVYADSGEFAGIYRFDSGIQKARPVKIFIE